MEAAFGSQYSAVSKNQQQAPFTAKDTKDTEEKQQRRFTAEERMRQRAEGLLRRIGEACDELERLAEENPEVVGRVTQSAEEHKDAYLRLKARLQMADAAPRCRWLKQDGAACRSPQMKKHIYCFAHAQMMEARALALSLPAMEDANAIQIGLMRIQKALIEDTISTKKAGLLLYSMQLALKNVGQTTFGQAKTEELVTEAVSEQEAFREKLAIGPSGHRDIRPPENQNRFTTEGAKEEQPQNQRSFTAEDTEGTEAKQRIPLMNTDNTDLWKADEEFVPVPEGYGYTRVRLRIDQEGKPVQAAIHPSKSSGSSGTPAIAPDDPAQVRVNLG